MTSDWLDHTGQSVKGHHYCMCLGIPLESTQFLGVGMFAFLFPVYFILLGLISCLPFS